MKDLISNLREKILSEIKNSVDKNTLEELRIKYLGKKGEFTSILRNMANVSKEERPKIGELINVTKQEIDSIINEKIESFNKIELEKRIKKETIDVTINKKLIYIGHRHPLNNTMEELENFFISMGFSVIDGPEIETVENNFNKLNSPMDHPSREMSDTFYIDKDLLLRTHTSPVQIRTMMTTKPPIKMVSAGRTFRFDEVDDTHSPMFHQIEGLVVGENINMSNLIDTLNTFIKEFFGEDMKTRYRPHYFPFTEPSAEVDVSCFNCKGKGCPVCNGTGWSMELLGCGMVHPNVLEACGIDSKKYSGFAFGMGIDRITMVKHKINNIRLLYDNDKRFLEQF